MISFKFNPAVGAKKGFEEIYGIGSLIGSVFDSDWELGAFDVFVCRGSVVDKGWLVLMLGYFGCGTWIELFC